MRRGDPRPAPLLFPLLPRCDMDCFWFRAKELEVELNFVSPVFLVVSQAQEAEHSRDVSLAGSWIVLGERPKQLWNFPQINMCFCWWCKLHASVFVHRVNWSVVTSLSSLWVLGIGSVRIHLLLLWQPLPGQNSPTVSRSDHSTSF
jgi:hypothetical protein